AAARTLTGSKTPCELFTLRPPPCHSACKHDRKMKANFCPRSSLRCRNPAQNSKNASAKRPAADCGNKNVKCGSSRRKPHRASGNVYTEGFQARPEPLDGLVNSSGVGGIGPGPIASPDAERRRRENPNLLSAADADDPAGSATQRARAR